MLIVLKAGGDLLVNGFPTSLTKEIKVLSEEHKIIMIHGGGDIVTEISTKLGHPPIFVMSPHGYRSRYTDKQTAEIFTMVMAGKINKEIISVLQKNGVNAIGISGLDGAAIQANRKEHIIVLNEKGKKILINGGYTGQITSVNTELFNLLLCNGYVPVVCAVAMGLQAEPLNVDGDRMAANIASSMKADRLILLTDVEGIIIEGKRVDKLTSYDAKELNEKIGPGMSTKVLAALEAVNGGIEEVIIASGFMENAVTAALNHSTGTAIRK